MKKHTVTHPGVVSKIEGNSIDVSIIVSSACVSCEIKGACTVSEVEKKSVIISVDDPENYKINQHVHVEMQQSQGTWAVLLGYIFPFIVLLISLIIFINTGMDQGMAGLISILLLIPYYLVIYLIRNYIGSKFSYTIRP